MNKKLIAGISVILMICGLDGCGKGDAMESQMRTESVVAQTRVNAEKAVGGDIDDIGNDEELRILTNMNSAFPSCMTENGYYYITGDYTELEDGSYGQHMMYMDFATRQEVCLCSTTGCSHDTKDCTAVLSGEEFGNDSVIFCHDNALYILSREYDQDGVISVDMMGDSASDEDIQGTCAALYRMNLDGTLRKKVYEFDADQTLENVVLGDDTDLYFIEKKTEARQMNTGNATYTSATDRKIIKMDTVSWEPDTVWQFEENEEIQRWSMIGCFDESLVLSGLSYDHVLTDEEILDDDASLENLKNAVVKFAVLDLADETVRMLDGAFYEAAKNISSEVKDEYMYISEEGSSSIRRLNMKTGEETVLADLENNRIWQAFDEVLCCTSWGDDLSLYFVDLSDGTVSHSGLVNQSLGWMLEFAGETKDQFLVVYDYDATSTGDGSYEINRYCYGLIAKEDLYQGKADYLPIEMIGKGR